MVADRLEEIEREIERLRRRYAVFLRETPGLRAVMARWAAEATGLCWFVPLEDVAEPDIDVEITSEVLIVRADRVGAEPVLLLGILPVPRGFDLQHPVIRFSEETLEIHVRRFRDKAER